MAVDGSIVQIDVFIIGPAQQDLDALDQKPMREWFTDEVIGPIFRLTLVAVGFLILHRELSTA
jgi:hypothetical protein